MQANITEKWGKKPFLISGPCSAETNEQVFETARAKGLGRKDISVVVTMQEELTGVKVRE